MLKDDPSDEDELSSPSGGPHRRVANAVASLITTSECGYVVSIEGGWGSGKSTVVRLIEQALPAESLVITFDAWAHSGDALRRNFLNCFLQQLLKSKWLNDASTLSNWRGRLEGLSRRRTERKVVTIPTPTAFGSALAVTTLLVPAGVALISGAVSRGGTLIPTTLPNFDLAIGIALALGPLVCAAIFWIQKRFRGKAIDWAVLSGGRASNQVVTEDSDPEPTSVEFEQMFFGLCDEALGNGRSLVVVVDNLDRLSSNEAIELWSTLQVFIQVARRQAALGQRLWLLVPFDPSHMQQMLASPPGVQSAKTDNISALLDKAFQLRFELAPPVAADWRNYLRKLVETALPGHVADAYGLYQIYKEINPGAVPTPRELKSIVNQIGSIHRQWKCGHYTFLQIGCYVLLRRTGKNLPEWLLSAPISENLSHLLGPDAQVKLSGLAFNVDSSRGIQLLLEEPIKSALLGSRQPALDDLLSSHGDGFWAVLQNCQASLGTGPDDLAVHLLSISSNPGLLNSNSATSFLSWMLARALKVEVWPEMHAELGAALGEVVSRVDATKATQIAKHLQSTLRAQSDASKPNTAEISVIEGVRAFKLAIESHGLSYPIEHQYGFDAQRWIEDIKAIPELSSEPTMIRCLGSDELISHIATKVRAGELMDALLGIEELVLEQSDGWAAVVGSAWMRLSTTPEENWRYLEVERLLEIILLVGSRWPEFVLSPQDVEARQDTLESLSRQLTSNEGDVSALALMAASMVSEDYFQVVRNRGRETFLNAAMASRAPAFMESLLDTLNRFNLEERFVSFLWRNEFTIANRDSWVGIAISEKALQPHIDVSDFFSRWSDTIRPLHKRGDTSAIAFLASELPSRIGQFLRLAFNIRHLDLYVLGYRTAKEEELFTWCTSKLSELNKSDWLTAFGDAESREGLERYAELVSETRRGYPATLELLDSVVMTHDAIIRGEVPADLPFDPVVLLSENHKEVFAQRVVGLLISTGGQSPIRYIQVFKNHLIYPSAFSSDLAVNEVLAKLIDSGESGIVAWTSSLLMVDKDFSSKVTPATWNAFRMRCEAVAEAGPEEVKASLLQMLAYQSAR